MTAAAIAARWHGQGERELRQGRGRSRQGRSDRGRRATAGRCGARQGSRGTRRDGGRKGGGSGAVGSLAWPLRRRPTARPSRPRPRPTKPTGRRSPPMRRRQRRRSPPPGGSQRGRQEGACRQCAAVVADGAPRKPPPWPRPLPMRRIKGASEDSLFLRRHTVRRGHAGRPPCDAGRCADSARHDGYRMGRCQLERTAQACSQ